LFLTLIVATAVATIGAATEEVVTNAEFYRQ